MIDSPGQRLGNYRLIGLLGTGGMASVYLAEHVHLGTQAAIKVLSPRLQRNDLERFLTEARLIARLEHPHIVRVLEFGVEADQPFLVMSYAPGGSLRQFHPIATVLPLDMVVSYVKQVAQALQYAHDEHVIHRDIKPENMLLGRRNEVLLSDFGLAVLAPDADAQQVHRTAGTIAYMAPEQIQGQTTAASDQYALGIVVYEWLCGKRPFIGSLAAIANGHLSVAPPPLHEQVPTIPSAIEEVVLKALRKDPGERFATVHAFARALEETARETSSGQTQRELASAYVGGLSSPQLKILPAPLTSLIGREQEVAEACALLRRPEVRLLTLTGTGGIGKTRLALQVATEMMDDFADGICFVSLAPISDPDQILPAIGQTLGLKASSEHSWLDLLQAFFQHKRLFLILDNFEQIVTAAPPLVPLLQKCPGLKILVTSRTLLHLGGEHHFPVEPLAVPDLKQLPDHTFLAQYAAVALFVQRAQALRPDFQLASTNSRAVAELCVRLDGLPLAIELAAARIPLFSPQALLARLSQRFALLTSREQDAPTRQQTLRNTIAWSYDLLDASEQRLFCRLAVFVGGCTFEAIEAICSQLDDGVGEVLEGVASLIDKSLLQQREQEDGEPRFVMLETNREYGLEALSGSGEREITRRAHAAYYLTLAEQAATQLSGPQQAIWLERLEREHDNLQATMAWSLEAAQAGLDPEIALRLGLALRDFWSARGFFSEGRAFLEQALAHSAAAPPLLHARASYAAAFLAAETDNMDIDRAEALCEQSVVLFRELGDKRGIAYDSRLRAFIALGKGAPIELVYSLLEESLALFRELGDKNEIAWSLFALADKLALKGEFSRLLALFEESLALFRELGNKRGMMGCVQQLAGFLLLSRGDQATIRARLEEHLTLCKELGDRMGMAFYCWMAGWVALSQDDTVTAYALEEQSRALMEEMGSHWHAIWAIAFLGLIKVRQGDFAAAHNLFEESLTAARAQGDTWAISFCLDRLADLVATQGACVWAACLWGTAEALRRKRGIMLMPAYADMSEPAIAAARAQMGEQAFHAAWTQGMGMTVEQVLAASSQADVSTQTTAEHPSAITAKTSPSYPAGLTAREVDVLRLVAQGLTDVQVAEHLVISPRTVNTHLKSIYGKIQVSSRSAATRYALGQKLV